MGTSAVAERARGRAIQRGYAEGAAWNASADTGQAIPIGRAVAACPTCNADSCAIPSLTPGYYRYAFLGQPYPPPTTVGATAFDFLPGDPAAHGLTLLESGPEVPTSSPIPFIPYAGYYENMWFFRFSLLWSQPTATINFRFYLDDGYALRYRDRSVCGPWIPAGESWEIRAGPGEGGPLCYSLPITLTQDTLYDFELVCANLSQYETPPVNIMVCYAWYVLNPTAIPNNPDMTNPTLDGQVENSLLEMIYWYPY